MTIIKIKKVNNYIVEVDAEGHSGFATSGKDIICASISSIIQTAYLGICKVYNISAMYKVDEKKAKLVLRLKKENYFNQNASVIFNTMYAGLEDIAFGNENYIKLEVKDEIN